MKSLDPSGYTLSICGAIVTLAGCGGSQLPIGGLPSTVNAYAKVENAKHSAVEFAYVTNLSSNNVSAYAINASTGALTQLTGSPFAAGYQPTSVAVDANGKFLYVANNGSVSGHYSGNVSAYAINAHTGVLTPIKGSPFPAGDGPTGVATDPTGKFAYVTNYASFNVSAYAVNSRTGALKQVHGSPFNAGPHAPLTAVAVDHAGRFVYVTDLGRSYPYSIGRVYGYTINARTGALTRIKGSPFEAGYGPDSLAIDPAGKFVYVTNYGSGDVSGYSINANTGFLTQVAGSAFEANTYASGVAIGPNGKFVYVPTAFQVYAYAIDPLTGALALVQRASAPGTVNAVAIDPTGKFAYVTASVNGSSYHGGVSAYAINASSGTLTPVNGSPYAAGYSPDGVATCRVEANTCVPPAL
ncbi:MAG: beta-propeller fold lactonase family protein [Candidatus Cybelea sp.]